MSRTKKASDVVIAFIRRKISKNLSIIWNENTASAFIITKEKPEWPITYITQVVTKSVQSGELASTQTDFEVMYIGKWNIERHCI